jgi:catechol 2,3-dioxygenase-like lactoylglutathione lyase family enzyme
MSSIEGLKVLFVAGFGPIVRAPAESRQFYLDTLGLPLEAMPDDDTYLHAEKLDGVKHFALWPLAQAAQSCFGSPEWPAEVPAPHAWLELDVEDVAVASASLKKKGYELLVDNRTEPWGQVVTRLLSPEGMLVGLTYTPWMRK